MFPALFNWAHILTIYSISANWWSEAFAILSRIFFLQVSDRDFCSWVFFVAPIWLGYEEDHAMQTCSYWRMVEYLNWMNEYNIIWCWFFAFWLLSQETKWVQTIQVSNSGSLSSIWVEIVKLK